MKMHIGDLAPGESTSIPFHLPDGLTPTLTHVSSGEGPNKGAFLWRWKVISHLYGWTRRGRHLTEAGAERAMERAREAARASGEASR